jgi:nucleoside-diphosphate-sugar epimerase
MKVWLSGGMGFIGRNLLPFMVELNYELSLLRLEHNRFSVCALPSQEPLSFFWDSVLPLDMQWPDCILHFGASGVGNPLDKVKNKDDFELTIKLCHFLKKFGYSGRFYFAGTIDEYGNSKVRNENTKLASKKLQPYAYYKLLTFDFLTREFEATDIQYCHLRIANLFGLNQRQGTLLPLLLDKKIETLQLNSLSFYRDQHYVGDFSSNLCKLLECTSIPRVLNLGSGKSVKMSDFAQLVWKLAGKDPLALTFAELDDSNKRPENVHMDISLAKRILSNRYSLKSYDEAIIDIIKKQK